MWRYRAHQKDAAVSKRLDPFTIESPEGGDEFPAASRFTVEFPADF